MFTQRRNPIIADVFSCLIYMERRGSGFKKIIEDYQFQHKYTEELAPMFLSEHGAFFLTLRNLNFNSNYYFRVKTEEKTRSDEMEARAKQTLELVRKDSDLTIKQIANELGISRQKVERTITRLQKRQLVSFCVDTGFTCFGLVEQDYQLPDDILYDMGLDVADIDYTPIDETRLDSTEISDLFDIDIAELETVELKMVRRGVVSVNKVGYFVT